MAVSTRTGVQIADISGLEVSDCPTGPNLLFLDHHFIDPGRRTLRVKSFYRLSPGEIHYRNKKKDENRNDLDGHENRHRHNWEKILLDLQLPLPDSGEDPIEPIGGWVRYHPEGVWYGPFDHYRTRVGPDDRVIVHCHVHTEGSAYQPMQTFQSMKQYKDKLLRESPEVLPKNVFEDFYVSVDGARVEAANATQCRVWEEWQGRRMTYKEPAIADDLIRLNVTAFPWFPHPSPGVKIKPLAVFNAMGPITSLFRIEPGASLPARMIDDHRMMAVMAGNVSFGDSTVNDRTIAYGSPGDEFPTVTANEPSLVWLVRWLWKDASLPAVWLD